MIGKCRKRPFACRIEFERLPDEWCSLRIERDCPKLAAFVVGRPDVAVAKWCPTDRSAAAHLLTHPFDDLVGEVARVELGD
ncbi:MAG: hypothetical protein Q8S43_06390 [Actinomycetota bacterium]|nr:hypothetical protein [Actinomycetota bacterium]